MKIKPAQIDEASSIVKKHSLRLQNSYKHSGGLIDLTNSKAIPLIIGDLHGSYENLNAIVKKNHKKIKSGKMVLIIIGDCEHNDQTGEMLEMESSLIVFEELINLILELKDNIIYLIEKANIKEI